MPKIMYACKLHLYAICILLRGLTYGKESARSWIMDQFEKEWNRADRG